MQKSLITFALVFAVLMLPALTYGQTEGKSGSEGDAPNLVGTWHLAYESEAAGVMLHAGEFELMQKGNRLKGSLTADKTTATLMGSCSNQGEIFLKQIDPVGVVIESSDDQKSYSTVIEFNGTLSTDGKQFEGTMTATDVESGKVVHEKRFAAVRKD